MLRYIAGKCGRPGTVSGAPDCHLDYPVADCIDASEMNQYVEYLVERKLLKEYASQDGESFGGYSPTIEGWQTVEPPLTAGSEPNRCFVAMDFHPALGQVYQIGIKPAVESCGMKCVCLRDPANPSWRDNRSHFVGDPVGSVCCRRFH